MPAFPRAFKKLVLRCLLFIPIFPMFFGGGVEASPMTLQQAIQTAVQNNKDLQTARYVVNIAKARLIQAGMSPNPRLSFSGYDAIFTNQPAEYELGVGVSTSTRGGGFKKSVGRSKRHVQMIIRPLKGALPLLSH